MYKLSISPTTMKAGTRRLGRCSTASPAMHSGRKLAGDKTDLKNVPGEESGMGA
ncbi:uncharacterized protein METZ01_LOCUS483760 [marine metagenome]|uniref:Uncharacterized protein n=1 Tax=marine metagenome TaxID=408172 RepID=A0A383CES5_9ZZZZ